MCSNMYLKFTFYRINMACSTAARPRTVFTEEQKRILIYAYDNGVNFINKKTDADHQEPCGSTEG